MVVARQDSLIVFYNFILSSLFAEVMIYAVSQRLSLWLCD